MHSQDLPYLREKGQQTGRIMKTQLKQTDFEDNQHLYLLECHKVLK